MGYMTDYEVEAGPFDKEIDAEFFLFKMGKQVGRDVGGTASLGADRKFYVYVNLQDVKWYAWRADLQELSREFLYVTIDVEGDGEETGDQWKARFYNGDFEKVEAIVTFPEFQRLT